MLQPSDLSFGANDENRFVSDGIKPLIENSYMVGGASYIHSRYDATDFGALC